MLILAMTSLVLTAAVAGPRAPAAPREVGPKQQAAPARAVSPKPSPARAPEKARPAAQRVLVLVSSPQRAGAARGRTFSARGITDLRFDTVFSGRLRGTHVLELKLFTPKGHLYEVLTVPFNGEQRGRRRRLPGNPRLYREQGMRAAGPGAYHVSARLPVAGTWIVTNSLYGAWHVDAHVDGAAWPSGRTGFTIQR